MSPAATTLSVGLRSSNMKPYWNPEHPPPWMKTRRDLPSASGILAAKSFTFSIARPVRLSVKDAVAGSSVVGRG